MKWTNALIVTELVRKIADLNHEITILKTGKDPKLELSILINLNDYKCKGEVMKFQLSTQSAEDFVKIKLKEYQTKIDELEEQLEKL